MAQVNVNIRDGKKHRDEVDSALRELKKQLKKNGLMQELRRREHYTAPSKARTIKRDESLKQRRRDDRKNEWQRNKEQF
jgi:ribosomal protein S21